MQTTTFVLLLISLVAVPCLGQIMMMPVETPIMPPMMPFPGSGYAGSSFFPGLGGGMGMGMGSFGQYGGQFYDPYQTAWGQQSTWGMQSPQTWTGQSWTTNGLQQYPTSTFGTTGFTDPWGQYSQFNTGSLTQTGYPMTGMTGMSTSYPWAQNTWGTQGLTQSSTFNTQTPTTSVQTQG